ncbi:MAG TPA: hypothetical protein VGX03_23825, partial [Candidatus Binatia bacterium]|nr:hypothetical protein [Candidatus Binatia bacterium]
MRISPEHRATRALDADSKGALKDIHRRVGAAILFESSGGQGDKVAHLPELRFALGEPEVDTTSLDNAAVALETKGFYIRRAGSDGFRFGFDPTLKKVVSDRRTSLDDDEVKKAAQTLVKKELERGAALPLVPFPEDGSAVQDTPRLTLVVLDPESEWDVGQDTGASSQAGSLRHKIAEWTKQRGKSPRLYPGSLVWCVRKPGCDLKEKIELWLAWRRVEKEINDGTLGGDFDRADRSEITTKVRDAEEAAKDEVWASYRFVLLADSQEGDGLKIIDLGAGHASASETLCGRVVTALKSQALLNESPGASYLERRWPPRLKNPGRGPSQAYARHFSLEQWSGCWTQTSIYATSSPTLCYAATLALRRAYSRAADT